MPDLPLADETYVNLATFRRDGREVRTPVWVAPSADGTRLVVYTNVNSGKVKRIRNGGRVRLAACNARGAVRGDWIEGAARVLDDPDEREAALGAMVRKYSLQMRVALALSKLTGRYAQRAALEISV